MTQSDLNLVIACCFIAFLTGGIFGAFLVESGYQTLAIKHNVAHYDANTGEWKWNQ